MNTFRINSNPASALAYRNLSKTQSGLQTTLERLSSGMRINKAADDSAGSAISTRMSSQIRGMKQANRNAQDTNNLLSTAESGLSDISDILSKMRELSVQASTDTLNDVDRASIDLEFQSLKDELTRIANVTEYNGMNVLNGTYQTAGRTSSQWPLPEIPITRDSIHTNGTEGNDQSWNAGYDHSNISADGRYVAFNSDANNLADGDTNGKRDVFVHDRETGATELASVHTNGTQGNKNSYRASMSADGRYVAFQSNANNLVDGDINEKWDVFVHDRETGATELVSVHTNGAQGNNTSQSPSISDDGRYVAFQSHASSLVNGDTNGHQDIFVHDRETGATERVSGSSNGTPANNHSWHSSISADGRYVAFQSDADNLVDGDTNGRQDIFVHDREMGATERVSVHTNGTQGNKDSHVPGTSDDGRYVAFESNASNLVDGDTNEKWDIFVHDRETDITERVSVRTNGTQGNKDSHVPSVSDDGRYVAFQSDADNLVDGDTNGRQDIFVHDRETGATERVGVHTNGTQGNGESRNPNISDDGRSILFDSDASNLVDGDNNGQRDVFTTSNPLYEARGHWRVQIGADNDINSQHEFSLTNATANGLDLEDDSVLSVDDARSAITAIDHAIDKVNQERSYIGSEQNKLQFTMSNLSNNIQNIEASRSSIEDADFAAEAAYLAKNQILAQSATAMLAQASAISQNILSLLR